MGSPITAPQGCTIAIATFDGSRQPMPLSTEVLFTVMDGNQKQVFRDFRPSQLVLTGLPHFDNFGDRYTVVAFAKGHEQAGFTPVNVAPNIVARVDLMLLGKSAGYNFSGATWEIVQAKRPVLAQVLAADAESPGAARDRYRELLENKSAAAAGLLNITTAMEQIHLPKGSPLDYFQHLIWDETMKQDRFFGFASLDLLDQVRTAAQQGLFAPEPGSAVFHPGATASFKQVQFGEANVQLTFHEEDKRTINGVDCVKVEPDIDYFKDIGAHSLLEVIPNTISHGLTDPRQVYVLRWIAGRRAGIPEFDPLYTIV
jgi:hypothetical protein